MDRDELERAVAASCRARDYSAAATATLRGYGGELLGFLGALARDATVAQEVFAQFSEDLWRALPEFRWESALRTWCYTLARNAWLRYAKREARSVPVPPAELHSIVDEVKSTTAPFLRTTVGDALRQARAGLESDDQALLILRVNRGLPWQEIARVMADDGDGQAAIDAAVLARRAAALRKRFERIKQVIRDQLGVG